MKKPDGLLIGQKTCRKEDPEQVASNSRNTDGTRILNRMEWLSKPQIHFFFRKSLLRESNQMARKLPAMTLSLTIVKN